MIACERHCTEGPLACLQVPGLNAPIPPGAQFGYQPGGWGKPPVDEEGNPLYGDVFGLAEEPEEEEPVSFLGFGALIHLGAVLWHFCLSS